MKRLLFAAVAITAIAFASPAPAMVLVWGGNPYVGRGEWGGCINNQCFTVHGFGNWRKTFF